MLFQARFFADYLPWAKIFSLSSLWLPYPFPALLLPRCSPLMACFWCVHCTGVRYSRSVGSDRRVASTVCCVTLVRTLAVLIHSSCAVFLLRMRHLASSSSPLFVLLSGLLRGIPCTCRAASLSLGPSRMRPPTHAVSRMRPPSRTVSLAYGVPFSRCLPHVVSLLRVLPPVWSVSCTVAHLCLRPVLPPPAQSPRTFTV